MAAQARRPPPRVLTASEREGGVTECQGNPLGGGMPRPSEGGTGQVDFPCAQVWAGTGPLANLSTKPECCPLTCPCPAKELSLFPLCHHQRRTGEAGLVLPPHPPASVSREPLGGARAAGGSNQGLSQACRLCCRWWRGPGTTSGRSEDTQGWTESPALIKPGVLPSARHINALAGQWLVYSHPHVVPTLSPHLRGGVSSPADLSHSVFTGGGMFYLLP